MKQGFTRLLVSLALICSVAGNMYQYSTTEQTVRKLNLKVRQAEKEQNDLQQKLNRWVSSMETDMYNESDESAKVEAE